jgi:hypothetical protein
LVLLENIWVAGGIVMKALLSTAIILLLGASGCMPVSQVFAEETKDSSGTNPAVLNRSVSLTSELRFLANDFYYDVSTIRYTEPLGDGSQSIRFSAPLVANDVSGDDDAGLGDLSLKFTSVAYVDRAKGLILSGEITAPTASENYFGSGKWTFSPGVVAAFFVSPEVIIAPAYIHTFSFAGGNDRAGINRGDFDLYTVYKPTGEKWWLTSDMAVSYDFKSDKTPVSWKVAYGRYLGKLAGGGAINGSIKPGIGLGSDRSFDYSIELGLSVVGF